MKNQQIDLLPQQIADGTLTVKEAVNTICSFVIKNYPMFKLHKFDEDFRSEIFIYLLEHGEHIIRNYKSESSSFQKYLYYYIMSLISSKLKLLAKNSINEKISYEENLERAEEKIILYDKLNYAFIENPKAPYAAKVSSKDTIEALHRLKDSSYDKTILVLAIKSSYYLTDEQIDRVCRLYNLDKEIFYEIIQKCKDSIIKKAEKRNVIQERRNSAYYNHKRCRKLIEKLRNEDIASRNLHLIASYERKEEKYKRKWTHLNQSFEKGYMNLRPSNKTVADILGICERQVTYYIKCAKKDAEKKTAEEAEEQ